MKLQEECVLPPTMPSLPLMLVKQATLMYSLNVLPEAAGTSAIGVCTGGVGAVNFDSFMMLQIISASSLRSSSRKAAISSL